MSGYTTKEVDSFKSSFGLCAFTFTAFISYLYAKRFQRIEVHLETLCRRNGHIIHLFNSSNADILRI